MKNYSMIDDEEELPPSKLGTHEYWDSFYENEIKNFKEADDEGEIWFGEKHMMKVVKWIEECREVSKDSSILDIGCGNGAFLHALADSGYNNLHGIDYSSTGVELARSVAVSKHLDIQYEQADFLDESYMTRHNGTKQPFDLCHDKGTYDAISLRSDNAKVARHRYIQSLRNILKDDGFFVITSCNWTLDQLKQHFHEDFEFLHHIKAPTFSFGGQTGSTVSAAVFRKLHDRNT